VHRRSASTLRPGGIQKSDNDYYENNTGDEEDKRRGYRRSKEGIKTDDEAKEKKKSRREDIRDGRDKRLENKAKHPPVCV
jgi:hypothetical protein